MLPKKAKLTKKGTSYRQILKLLWTVTPFVMSEGIWVDKCFGTRGTCQPHPQCSLHTCVHIAAHGVDGPYMQPSTQHLYTLLMPPHLKVKGYCAGIATSEASDSAEEEASGANSVLLPTGPETSVATYSDSWGAAWRQLWLGQDRIFMWGWDRGNGRVRYGSPQEPIETLCLWSCHC